MKKQIIVNLIMIGILLLPIFCIADTVQAGSGTGTGNYFPISGNYQYNYTQQIYLQSQINKSGNITRLRFYYSAGDILPSKDWIIYMGHTTKTTFSSGNDWVSYNDLSQVFAGDVSSMVPLEKNWMEIVLDNPFNYNNENNLVIAVDENTEGASTAATSFGVFNSGTYTGMYCRSNTTNIDPILPLSGSRTKAINIIQFVFPNTSLPLAPIMLSPVNNNWAFTDESIYWGINPGFEGAGDANSYDVYFGIEANPPLVSENQTQLSYSTILENEQTYYWKVVAKNEFGQASSQIWNFKTPSTVQLAESFENPTFPPLDWWCTPGRWSYDTTRSKHGIASAKAGGSASNQFILSTPKLRISPNSTFSFWAMSSSVQGTLQVIYSPDRINWSPIGNNITFATQYLWYNITIDLTTISGTDCYLGIGTGLFAGPNYYIDSVFGPDVLLPPGAPILNYPEDGAINISITPTLSWSAPTTGGVPRGYYIYCDIDSQFEAPLDTLSAEILDYTIISPLNYNTTYYWTVSAYNDDGEGLTAPVRHFTTTSSILNPPHNVTIMADNNSIYLTWEAQPEATYYIIYGADDPYGEYTLLGYSETNSYVYSAMEDNFNFFKIVASNGIIPVKETIINESGKEINRINNHNK